MKLLDTTPKAFEPEEAERIAKELQLSDPEWTYKVIHDPKGTGWSYIEIFDDEGFFVGEHY